MDTWIVHYFNAPNGPRVQSMEVQAYDLIAAANQAMAAGIASNMIFSVRLKAPIVVPE